MITLLLAVIALLLYCLFSLKNKKRLPPGPWGWPFVGNSPLLRKLSQQLNGQHIALSKLADSYKTPILRLTLGNQPVVVVFKPELVKEVLTRDEFIGRPDSFFTRLRCFGGRRGITFVDGEVWHHQRRFTLKTLRSLGMGKERMEDLIIGQVHELIQEYSKEIGPQSIIDVLSPCIVRVLWEIAAGTRLSPRDPHLQGLIRILNVRNRALDMAGGILSRFPWIRHIAPQWSGYSVLTELNAEMREFLMEAIQMHKLTYDEQQTRDLIDAFLHEGGPSSPESHLFTEDQLIMVLTDLFLGGATSTSTSLDFAFLVMAKYPEVQEKVYKEICNQIASDKWPCYADRIRLPYTMAVLLEVQRISSIIPVAGPRRVLNDTCLGGYHVPKETTVLMSFWSVHMDQTLFPEPERFKPERYLDLTNRAKLADHIIPFGLGKRRCLGENLAQPCLFLIFTGILRTFQICKDPKGPDLSIEPTPGIILKPMSYKVIMCRRENGFRKDFNGEQR